MVLIGSMMGEVFSYIDEKKGLIIQNICPVKGKEQTQENVGSDFLEFHTEDSFHPFPPDLLMLICLRGDRTGKALTITASIERVIKLLSKNSIELLSQPNYTIRASTSFRDSKYVKNVSILSYENGSVNMIFDPSGMTCDDAKCAEAMEELYALLQCESYGACLQPGEAIIINNKKACHARTHFTPFYDGRDRWLQRVFLTKQLPKLKGLFVPGTRMLKRL